MTQTTGYGASVLIADDDVLVRTVLRMAIEKHGYRVVDVTDGFELLEEVRKSSFDLCIMDASMQGPSIDNRLQVLQQNAPEMALLVISGYADQPEIVRNSTARFMAKPLALLIAEDTSEPVAKAPRSLRIWRRTP